MKCYTLNADIEEGFRAADYPKEVDVPDGRIHSAGINYEMGDNWDRERILSLVRQHHRDAFLYGQVLLALERAPTPILPHTSFLVEIIFPNRPCPQLGDFSQPVLYLPGRTICLCHINSTIIFMPKPSLYMINFEGNPRIVRNVRRQKKVHMHELAIERRNEETVCYEL